MKQVFNSTTTKFKEIYALTGYLDQSRQYDSKWITREIANTFDIDIADSSTARCGREMSRITIEDEYTLIIVDVPVTEEK